MLTAVKKPALVKRNGAIDLFRIIACFGVVVIHVHNSTYAAEKMSMVFLYFCVPYFYTAALSLFAAGLKQDVKVRAILLKIARRIGIPFICWTTIYLVLLLVKAKISHKVYLFNLIEVFAYGETAEHLYYLPQLIMMELLVLSTYLLVIAKESALAVVLSLVAIIYLTWGAWNRYFGITALSNVIAYTTVAFFIVPKMRESRHNWMYIGVGGLLIFLGLSNQYFANSLYLTSYFAGLPLCGIGLFLIALNLPGLTLPRWVSALSLVTYGIYLSHVAFVEAFESASNILHYQIRYTLVNKVVISFIIFCLSAGAVFIVRKFKYGRVLLLGEE